MAETHPYRKEKIIEIISHAAGEFVQIESNKQSLITVTRVGMSQDFQKAIIFVTVFPEDQEVLAIDFLKRSLSDFRDFVKLKTKLQHIPWFDFQIDNGEKNRQRIDEISIKN